MKRIKKLSMALTTAICFLGPQIAMASYTEMGMVRLESMNHVMDLVAAESFINFMKASTLLNGEKETAEITCKSEEKNSSQKLTLKTEVSEADKNAWRSQAEMSLPGNRYARFTDDNGSNVFTYEVFMKDKSGKLLARGTLKKSLYIEQLERLSKAKCESADVSPSAAAAPRPQVLIPQYPPAVY